MHPLYNASRKLSKFSKSPFFISLPFSNCLQTKHTQRFGVDSETLKTNL